MEKIMTLIILINISSFTNDGTGNSLFKKADKALYNTKNEGRNGVTIFSSDTNK